MDGTDSGIMLMALVTRNLLTELMKGVLCMLNTEFLLNLLKGTALG